MEESLSHRTLKNALWQVGNLGWVTVLNFFITPLLLKKLGVADYGVYILVLTVISFLSLVELGTGAGFMRSFLEYSSKGEHALREKLINTFFTYWIATGIAGSLALVAVSGFIVRGFHIQSLDARMALYFGAGYFFVTMASALFLGIVSALQRFDIVGKAVLVQNTVLNALLVLCVVFRPSVSYLLFATFGVGALNLVLYFVFTKQVFPELRFRFGFDAGVFGAAFHFSFFNFINSLANNAVLQVDRFFISRMLSPAALPLYVVPNNLSQKIYSVSSSAGSVLFPVASELSFREEKQSFVRAYQRSMRAAIVFSVLSGVTMLLYGYKLLLFWIGKEFADQGMALLYWFVPTYVMLSMSVVLNNFFLGLGKAKFLAMASLGMAVLNVAGLLVLIPRYGISGAAMAYLLCVLPVLGIMLYFERAELAFRGQVLFYGKLFARLAILSILLGAGSLFLSGLIGNVWAALVVMAFSFAGIMAVYALPGFAEREDVETFMGFFKKLIHER